MAFELKQTGDKQKFSTGAQRDSASNKCRPDLVSPFAVDRVSWIYKHGADWYGDRNWERGMPFSRVLASLERHLVAYKQGKTDEDHLGQLVWNGMALLHYEEVIKLGLLPAELNDLPRYIQQINDLPFPTDWTGREGLPLGVKDAKPKTVASVRPEERVEAEPAAKLVWVRDGADGEWFAASRVYGGQDGDAFYYRVARIGRKFSVRASTAELLCDDYPGPFDRTSTAKAWCQQQEDALARAAQHEKQQQLLKKRKPVKKPRIRRPALRTSHVCGERHNPEASHCTR